MNNVVGELNRAAIITALAATVIFSLGACTDQPAPGSSLDSNETGEVDLVGMYRYMADAANFEDCESSKKYPLLIEGAHLDVERAYLKLKAGGEPVLLSSRFEIVDRAPEPGMPERAHLRVIRFDGFQPGEACPP